MRRILLTICTVTLCFISKGQPTVLILGDDANEIETAGLYDCIPCGFDNKNYKHHGDFLATTWTKNGYKSVGRSLMRFNLSQIPVGATIISAELDLFHFESPDNSGHSQLSGSNSAQLLQVANNWDATTVTWNNQPAYLTTNPIQLSATLNNTQDVLGIDVLTFVKDWYANPNDNYGLIFRLNTEEYYRAMLFGSAENPDTNVRPRLTIVYTLEDEIHPDPLEPLVIDIPNVFTPNNDGVNDVFQVDVLNYLSYKISIFNRWGSEVFQSNDATSPWDGTFQNRPVADGVYFYMIDVMDLFGKNHQFSSTVHLLK